MGQRELELLGQELLDVGALDIVGLLELDDTEDLIGVVSFLLDIPGYQSRGERGGMVHTWMDLKRARWRAAMSWYRASTASVRDISRYSLYMLWVPERES